LAFPADEVALLNADTTAPAVPELHALFRPGLIGRYGAVCRWEFCYGLEESPDKRILRRSHRVVDPASVFGAFDEVCGLKDLEMAGDVVLTLL
jgi:hypothetical protein